VQGCRDGSVNGSRQGGDEVNCRHSDVDNCIIAGHATDQQRELYSANTFRVAPQ